jgi:hypothetical protein
MAKESEAGREDVLAGRRGGLIYQGVEAGKVKAVFTQPLRDPTTGRDRERVFVFLLNSEGEISVAEAWIEAHYPSEPEGGQ